MHLTRDADATFARMTKVFFLSSALALFCFSVNAQFSVRDTAIFTPHVSVSFAYQFPLADMSTRFGNNLNTGIGFHIKSSSNWYYGIQWTYLFGRKVTEPGLLQNLFTDAKEILDDQGQIAIIVIQERGYTIGLHGGKLFPVIGPNPNSGILVTLGGGFIQHKIRIEHTTNEIAALEGEYLKGYDRLTNGVMISQFAGYYHMSNSRLTNFFVGLEAYQGFTQSRRDFNFDTQTTDTKKRLDILVGVRAGWTLHLHRRPPEVHYFE